jgi:AcrR family transcriptional regulator
MREIAAATGASLGSIYHHFASKEDLLRSILSENFRRVDASLAERLQNVADPRQALVAAVENHVAFFARHLEEMRVMSHELDTLSGEAGAEVAAVRRRYATRVTDILRRLRPDLSEGDLRVASLCLFGMVNWTYRWFHTLPSEVDAGRLGRRMAALFLDGFVGNGTGAA